MSFYIRDLASVLMRFATLYPIIGITGPRQSGKTTLAKLLSLAQDAAISHTTARQWLSILEASYELHPPNRLWRYGWSFALHRAATSAALSTQGQFLTYGISIAYAKNSNLKHFVISTDEPVF